MNHMKVQVLMHSKRIEDELLSDQPNHLWSEK